MSWAKATHRLRARRRPQSSPRAPAGTSAAPVRPGPADGVPQDPQLPRDRPHRRLLGLVKPTDFRSVLHADRRSSLPGSTSQVTGEGQLSSVATGPHQPLPRAMLVSLTIVAKLLLHPRPGLAAAGCRAKGGRWGGSVDSGGSRGRFAFLYGGIQPVRLRRR